MAADPRSIVHPSTATLGELLDGIATCVAWLDADGAVLHLNEPAEDFFGISRNQASGRAMRDLGMTVPASPMRIETIMGRPFDPANPGAWTERAIRA